MIPKCHHFKECGGCSYQDIAYKLQVEHKKKMLETVTSVKEVEFIESPQIYGFRNKMEYSFEEDSLGLHPRERFDKVIDVKECPVFSGWVGVFLERVREFARIRGIAYYNRRKKRGVLRYLILRESKFTGDKTVILIVDKNSFAEYKKEWADMVVEALGSDVCIVLARRHETGDSALTNDYDILGDKKYMRMKVGNVEFDVSPYSFFQPNSYQIENMYSIIHSAVDESASILDLYTGIGSIPVYIGSRYRRTVGVELYDACIEDANHNLEKIRPAGDIKFIKCTVRNYLASSKEKFDYGILDPPRGGISYRVWLHLKRLSEENDGFKKIFYISCSLKNLKQDLDFIRENTEWKITRVTGVDQFVHTPHLETIVEIET